MPDPLPSDVVARLKCDPIAALAAAVLIVGSFPHIVSWALTAFGGPPGAPAGDRASRDARSSERAMAKANGAGRHAVSRHVGAKPVSPDAAARSNGEAKNRGDAKKRARGNGAHTPREGAAKHDEALLELMRANPGARTTEILRLSGRPRNSTVLSLERLEKAGLVEHAGRGKWTVVDPDLFEAGTTKPAAWIAPLSGKRVARHAADGRVRDEMASA